MFSYYGSKSQIIHHYPPPQEDKIIEPFAGSARYALRYFDRDVVLVDKYDVVVKIWKWLQECSKGDILKLPNLKKGEDLRKIDLSEGERLFLGMISGVASISPRNKVSAFAAEKNGRGNQLKLVADNLFKIRHWSIRLGDYVDLMNERATWFIDPPYQFGGDAYVHGKIDYNHLSSWARGRSGQAIVCENTKADWMDFSPMIKMRGAMYTTMEAIWSNLPTAFDNEQLDIFKDHSK